MTSPSGMEVFTDQPSATVTAGGTTTGSTSFTVTGSDSWPVASTSVTPNTFFRITDQADTSEIMLVTAAAGGIPSGQTWTVTRGYESTTPIAHAANWTAVQIITAGTLQTLKQATDAGSAVTYGDSSTETVLASYLPQASEIDAGTTFKVICYGTLGWAAKPTLQFKLYWGGSGAPGSAFTSTGSTALALIKTATNAATLTPTTSVTGQSFDLDCDVTLLSSTTATANMNYFCSGASLVAAGNTATTTNTNTSGQSTSAAITISGSGPLILTALWGTLSASNTLTATAPLIYRAA